jgi:hypothetical protein
MVGAVNKSEKMTRTSVTIPSSLKKEMNKIDVNWSAVVREAVRQRLDYESERNISEALPLNERLREELSKKPHLLQRWDELRVRLQADQFRITVLVISLGFKEHGSRRW